MSKSDREKVRHMFGEKCAYCGKPLGKTFHVDHVKPIYRGLPDHYREKRPDIVGKDEIDNMFPACPRCNRWKSTLQLEQFRVELSLQIERLRRNSAQFRLSEDYGMITIVHSPIVFWFEKYRDANK